MVFRLVNSRVPNIFCAEGSDFPCLEFKGLFYRMTLMIPYAEQFSLKPSRECEIFVYKIPRSVCEQELRSMFEKYGDIFHLRLIQRPEKRYNYAFVRFSNRISVKTAVLRWNGYEIRKQERISVCRSIENRKLVLFNVPRHLPSYEIKNFISLYTTGLQDVQAPEPRDGKSVNSGLAFLIYDTHTCASIAKKTLNLNKDFYKYKKPLFAEWHTPGLIWDDCEVNVILLFFQIFIIYFDVYVLHGFSNFTLKSLLMSSVAK